MTQSLDIIAQVTQDRPTLSRAFGQIADFLLANPQEFIQHPIRELADAIEVSEPSLIRFARRYEFKGIPDMRLAIAMALAASPDEETARLEPAISDKEVVNRRAKHAIAAAAAKLLAQDRSVLLDSGSTVQFMAPHLREAQPLSIMTTGLNLLWKLSDCSQHELILPGGVVRQNAMSLTGRQVEASLASMSIDTVYLGADSIDPQFGLSTFSEEEAHLNRAMMRACRRVVVVADASKFGSPKLHRISGLEDVDIIVSDDSMPEGTRAAIRDHGVELILVPVPAAL